MESMQLGWEAMLNRRGTTWRKLPERNKDNIDRESARCGHARQSGH